MSCSSARESPIGAPASAAALAEDGRAVAVKKHPEGLAKDCDGVGILLIFLLYIYIYIYTHTHYI